MSKTFKYTKFTGHYYCQYSDEWEQDGIDFEYKVEDKELLNEVIPLLMSEYFEDDKEIYQNKNIYKIVADRITQIISDNYLLDGLVERYEDELKEVFYDEAIGEFNK